LGRMGTKEKPIYTLIALEEFKVVMGVDNLDGLDIFESQRKK